MTAWVVTFALTLGVELLVAVPLLGLGGQPLRARIGRVIVANFLTHPIVYGVAQGLGAAHALVVLPLLEIGATLVEAAVYGRPRPVAFFASAIANGLSLVVSLAFWSVVSH